MPSDADADAAIGERMSRRLKMAGALPLRRFTGARGSLD